MVRTTDSEQAAADAALIASAPCLLQALMEIDQVFEADATITIVKGSPFHMALQMTIQKATGG